MLEYGAKTEVNKIDYYQHVELIKRNSARRSIPSPKHGPCEVSERILSDRRTEKTLSGATERIGGLRGMVNVMSVGFTKSRLRTPSQIRPMLASRFAPKNS